MAEGQKYLLTINGLPNLRDPTPIQILIPANAGPQITVEVTIPGAYLSPTTAPYYVPPAMGISPMSPRGGRGKFEDGRELLSRFRLAEKISQDLSKNGDGVIRIDPPWNEYMPLYIWEYERQDIWNQATKIPFPPAGSPLPANPSPGLELLFRAYYANNAEKEDPTKTAADIYQDVQGRYARNPALAKAYAYAEQAVLQEPGQPAPISSPLAAPGQPQGISPLALASAQTPAPLSPGRQNSLTIPMGSPAQRTLSPPGAQVRSAEIDQVFGRPATAAQGSPRSLLRPAPVQSPGLGLGLSSLQPASALPMIPAAGGQQGDLRSMLGFSPTQMSPGSEPRVTKSTLGSGKPMDPRELKSRVYWAREMENGTAPDKLYYVSDRELYLAMGSFVPPWDAASALDLSKYAPLAPREELLLRERYKIRGLDSDIEYIRGLFRRNWKIRQAYEMAAEADLYEPERPKIQTVDISALPEQAASPRPSRIADVLRSPEMLAPASIPALSPRSPIQQPPPVRKREPQILFRSSSLGSGKPISENEFWTRVYWLLKMKRGDAVPNKLYAAYSEGIDLYQHTTNLYLQVPEHKWQGSSLDLTKYLPLTPGQDLMIRYEKQADKRGRYLDDVVKEVKSGRVPDYYEKVALADIYDEKEEVAAPPSQPVPQQRDNAPNQQKEFYRLDDMFGF